MFILRQINMVLGKGQKDTRAELTSNLYRMRDVEPKYSLNIADGDFTSDRIRLDASDSHALQLPENYANTSRLHCCIRTNEVVKATIVSPDHGTSNVLIKGTNGSTNGNHSGIFMWQGTVTSITLALPAGSDSALIDYFLFKIPDDLTAASAWRLGARAIGVSP